MSSAGKGKTSSAARRKPRPVSVDYPPLVKQRVGQTWQDVNLEDSERDTATWSRYFWYKHAKGADMTALSDTARQQHNDPVLGATAKTWTEDSASGKSGNVSAFVVMSEFAAFENFILRWVSFFCFTILYRLTHCILLPPLTASSRQPNLRRLSLHGETSRARM